MRLVGRVLGFLLAMGPAVGCANVPEQPPPPGPTVACRNSVAPASLTFLNWELVVRPDSIERAQPFTATLGGSAVFSEAFLDAAQTAIPRGVDRVNLVDLNATVHVRSGTTGDDDVVLEPDPIPYTCYIGRNGCDPTKNLEGEVGSRGNPDCEPVGPTNPCGRFFSLPTSTDCDPGGICDGLGKAGPGSQCVLNGFCITRDLSLQLQEKTAQYTAIAEGDVLFGWDDESTGATLRDDPEDLDHGTWILPEAAYEEPTGPNGLRITVAGLPVALECTMGVDCKDPDLGTGCQNALSSRTPDSELISFPIQADAL